MIQLTERFAAPRAPLRALLSALPLVALATSFAPAARAQEPPPKPKPNFSMLPGYREYYASSYSPAAKNVALLNELKAGMGGARRVAFDPGKDQVDWLLCRGSFPIFAPGQASFATLVEAAINQELEQAGLSGPDAPKLLIALDQFDFSSAMFGNSHWKVDLTLSGEGKPPVSATSVHEFDARQGAGPVCRQISVQLQTALEGVLFKLYSAPGFPALFR